MSTLSALHRPLIHPAAVIRFDLPGARPVPYVQARRFFDAFSRAKVELLELGRRLEALERE
ncbi:hypothetical protein SS50377_22810 [Spironucleus salmonicida]|uniref:Uncharacterized protein n=1 Tax=Spironucleus salmonicida TaxID=348837 RepID=A0A9P8LVS8_9EUKA|nr:hypothetical protein SS50377_22810 [Spironucleus salmonicida]